MSNSVAVKRWSSNTVFLFAAIGAAVGLGNIWRFPYITGAHGGGAFLILYLSFVLLLCIPMVAAEMFIGNQGGKSPISSMRALIAKRNLNRSWVVIGWSCIIVSALIFSFYSVVAGWSLDYLYVYLFKYQELSAVDGDVSKHFADRFDSLLASPYRLTFWHTLVVLLTALVIACGVRKGLEKALDVLMPGLFLILIVLIVFCLFAADFQSAIRFLFTPDFSKITPSVALIALGQAFFSVAVGGGTMMTYGAYLPKKAPILKLATIICITDTVVAIFAGLAIFPFVFSFGLDPSEGPGLIFVTLSLAFTQMPAGQWLGIMFFLLLVIATFTTTFALLEPIVCWLEEKLALARPTITAITAGCIWLFGLGQALSFNIWSDFKPLSFIPLLKDANLFGITEFTVSSVMLPLNCLLIALFVGWVYLFNDKAGSPSVVNPLSTRLCCLSLRYPVPIAIVLVFAVAIYNNI